MAGDRADHTTAIFTEILISMCRLINNEASFVSQTKFYTTPALSSIVLAEILITVSLCVLLYESGSRSAIPRTKRLLNTLIIYAVNRCLLTLLVAIAELTVVRVTYCKMTITRSQFLQDANEQTAWTMGLDFIIGKLYANSLLASLNTRQHLRFQGSATESDVRVNTVHFANFPKLPEDGCSSKDGRRHFDVCDAVVIDIGTFQVRDKTTAL
ncbi:hypothetical protein BKA82DRAFT_443588 [Pisolithus tinctorius]|uniref:DUF6534 domain-containing protein n=1 Tax=Pisolithus tinctorius Marx 270 TaxID=870435 RepID=A0A0C3ND27_PISTI|nr:hypothetical protein BKA82DRAFT_443588 [Pisolithus tinctorius]KIN93730.1 hypothetical protein M404DRAFT_443588 [Pisolithus tinctorius Marx 270]